MIQRLLREVNCIRFSTYSIYYILASIYATCFTDTDVLVFFSFYVFLYYSLLLLLLFLFLF